MKTRSEGPALDTLEQFVLGAALSVALAALAFLELSRLAAALFGSGTLRAGIPEAAAALARLPSHLSDPAAAWGAPGRAALPGPAAYFAVLILPLVGLAGAGMGTVRVVRTHHRRRQPLGVEPHAGVATRLRRLEIRRPPTGRLTLGRVGGRLVAAEEGASLAVVGPSGCGKTTGFAIPALLEWDGPVVATSVKTDLLDATLNRRRHKGRVWIYDPTGCTEQAPAQWSPIPECATWAGAQRIASWLCQAASPQRGSVNNPDFWMEQAELALAPLLHAAAVSGRTISDVVRWVNTQEVEAVRDALARAAGMDLLVNEAMDTPDGRRLRIELAPAVRTRAVDETRSAYLAGGAKDTRRVLRDPQTWPAPLRAELEERVDRDLNGAVRAELEVLILRRGGRVVDPLVAAEALWAKEEKMRCSIYTTMQNVVRSYADTAVSTAAEGCDIDLDEWLSGPNTLYVVAPHHDQARLRPVLTVLLQSAVRRAYERANANRGRLANPCLVLLDEAGNIAPLRDLPAYAATARSHGITLVTVWQDLGQIDAIYGQLASVVLSNHRARIFGTGIGHPATLETVSRLIGDVPMRQRNWSKNPDGGRTVSEHTAYRRAAPVDALRRMDPTTAVLVYGSDPPARLELRPWYLDPALRDAVEFVTMPGVSSA